VTPAPQLSDRRLTLDGAAVHLASAGSASPDAPVLVLLHGAGMDHSIWRAQLASLGASGVRALAPDFPGHGGSAGDPRERISDLAAWVLRLADALGLERLALAGHSMGALVALEAGALLGPRASGLALIGAALEMPVNPALLTAAETDLAGAARMIAGWGFGPAAQADGRAEAGRLHLAGSRTGVLAADLRACARYAGAAAAAARLRCRTMVIAGERDRMTPARNGRALAEAVSAARFVELPGVGHMLPVEASERVAELLRDLLQ
jgi:pimeloyl-ACP methyl ester carboxylesterase